MIRLISIPPSLYIEIYLILMLYEKNLEIYLILMLYEKNGGMAYHYVPSAVKFVNAQRIAPLSEPEKVFK
jgi:hypothetical protein